MPTIKPTGVILWEGASPLDRSPIVAIATFKSGNRKTGNMIQVWILRQDLHPLEAIRQHADYGICGDCPHRGTAENDYTDRSCYVVVGQAPSIVWRTYKAGNYPHVGDLGFTAEALFTGRKIRWGAYGDPAMIPAGVVQYWNSVALDHTGYSHQWRHNFAHWTKGTFMASCDNETDYVIASMAGWKTFTVIPQDAAAPQWAKLCPATAEGSKATCQTCRLCDGSKAHVYVVAHGAGAKHV
jgi:hypothetical protein